MSATPNHVIVNEYGHWCAGCGEALDWDDDCPCCGGEGFEDENFDPDKNEAMKSDPGM